jgi:Ca2+/Na+ antiporter
MRSAIVGFVVVAFAALAPQFALSFVPYFKRKNKARVGRFHANFVLWMIFAPIVALAAHFLQTDATTKAAIEIFDWWIYTSIGLACLILLLITLIVSYKNHEVQRTDAERDFNAMALTEFSSFVLNNAQSLWVIAAFLVAAGGDLATTFGYGVVSIAMVFVAWAIAP